MDNCLMRLDFFNRVETQYLACDYMLLLAICVVHPLRKASGVFYFSPAAAKSVGIDHSAGVLGYKELDRLGLVIFDEVTLEMLSVDHFEINKSGGKNLGWNKSAAFLADRINSEKVKTGRAALEAEAVGREVVKSVSVPLNLISAAVPMGTLMTSDAVVALGLYCNEFLNGAGIGVLDVDLIAAMTRQTPAAVKAGVEMAVRRGIILVDWKTSEYFICRWFKTPGKLEYKNQIMNVIKFVTETSSKKLRKKVFGMLSEQFKTTSEKLINIYSIDSTSSSVLEFSLLKKNLALLHSTPQDTTSPHSGEKTNAKGRWEGGRKSFVFDEVKTKAALRAIVENRAWSAGRAAQALEAVLKNVTTEEAAWQAVEDIKTCQVHRLRKEPIHFWVSAARKAEADVGEDPHFGVDYAVESSRGACYDGLTDYQTDVLIQLEIDGNREAFALKYKEFTGQDLDSTDSDYIFE